MVWRIAGLVLSLCIVGYLVYAMLSSDGKVEQSVENNPAVQEQKKALEGEGVDTSKKGVKKSLDDAAKKFEKYQKQADDLQKDPP